MQVLGKCEVERILKIVETVPNESDRDMHGELALIASKAVGDTTNVVSSPLSIVFF